MGVLPDTNNSAPSIVDSDRHFDNVVAFNNTFECHNAHQQLVSQNEAYMQLFTNEWLCMGNSLKLKMIVVVRQTTRLRPPPYQIR